MTYRLTFKCNCVSSDAVDPQGLAIVPALPATPTGPARSASTGTSMGRGVGRSSSDPEEEDPSYVSNQCLFIFFLKKIDPCIHKLLFRHPYYICVYAAIVLHIGHYMHI